MDLSQHLTTQLKGMERLVDAETGTILFHHPTFVQLRADRLKALRVVGEIQLRARRNLR